MSELDDNLLLDIAADDKNLIHYRPAMADLTDSVLSGILLWQILYRWNGSGKKTFYKFKEPCKHAKYKEGDSWCEELGFSPKEFDTALKGIGTKITKGASKKEALEYQFDERRGDESLQDYYKRFDEALRHVVIYWTDGSRVTWYQLNAPLLAKFLKGVYLSKFQSRRYLKKSVMEFTYVTSEKGRTYVVPKKEFTFFTKDTTEDTSKETTKDSAPPDSSHQPASPDVAATSAAQSEKPLNPIVIEQINEAVAAGDARPMPLKAKKSKLPDKPKEPAKPRERDRLFDGVAFTCFEVDMNKLKTPLNKNTAKRIGVLVSWLKENEYTPEQLWDFARWYKGTYPDISMPRDAGKLELHWLKWEQSGQPKVTASAALPEYDPTNDPTYRAIPPEQRVDASTIAQRIGARYGKSGL